jgi:hypothetical protein
MSPISGKPLLQVFKNEYLENADQTHGASYVAPKVAHFKRRSNRNCYLTPKPIRVAKMWRMLVAR